MKIASALLSIISIYLWSPTTTAGFAAVGPASITFIENGWFGEGFSVHLSSGITGCGAPATEFGIPASHPAYKELVSLMMSAFFTEKKVEVVVNQGVCTLGNRTSIVSIRLR